LRGSKFLEQHLRGVVLAVMVNINKSFGEMAVNVAIKMICGAILDPFANDQPRFMAVGIA